MQSIRLERILNFRRLFSLFALAAALTPVYAGTSRAPSLPPLPAQKVSAALTAACEEQLKPFHVEVTANPSRVEYNFEKSIAELTAQSKALGTLTAGVDNVIGLTETRYVFNAHALAPLIDEKSGYACLRMNMRITIDTGPQTIFVAKEFADNPCAMHEIIEHEKRHAQLNFDLAESVARHAQERYRRMLPQHILYGRPEKLEADYGDLSGKS